MTDAAPGIEPEFRRMVAFARLSRAGEEHEIIANAAECEALAARFGILAVVSLRASVRLRAMKRGLIGLEAHLEAVVRQACVVTLEPVQGVIDHCFTLRFIRAEPASDIAALDLDPLEDVEPLSGEEIDIGEIVAEELALSLDPYPRSPGAEAMIGPGGVAPVADDRAAENRPFVVLARLKRNS